MTSDAEPQQPIFRPAVRPVRRQPAAAIPGAPALGAAPLVGRRKTSFVNRLRTAAAGAVGADYNKVDLIVAATLLLSYLVRVSILGAAIRPAIGGGISVLYYGGIALALFRVFSQGHVRVWATGVVLLLATGASTLLAEEPSEAAVRWAGWAALLVAVGPVVNTPAARRLRAALFQVITVMVLGVTAAAAVWWVARVPSYGRGSFAGPMSHSMMLAPMAALAAVLSLARGVAAGGDRRSARGWFVMFVVAAGVTVVAGSRAALGAMVVGSCAVAALRSQTPAGMFVLACLLLGAVVGRETLTDFAGDVLDEELSQRFVHRELLASREGLWQARLAEFKARPVCGIGFGQVIIRGYNDDPARDTVEPGSSYLAILSMTGTVGALAILLMSGSVAYDLHRRWRSIPLEHRLIVGGWAVVWGVHLLAEGYILSVGSLLCMMVWSLPGWAADLASAPAAAATAAAAARPMLPRRRVSRRPPLAGQPADKPAPPPQPA